MTEFIDSVPHVEDNIASEDDSEVMEVEDDKLSLDSFADYEPIADNNPSDYYGFTNVS